MTKPLLHLFPNLLGRHEHPELFFPPPLFNVMQSIDGLIAESEKGGRLFLSYFDIPKRAHNIPLALLNKHTSSEEFDFLLEPTLKGENWGIVSDAGLPCLADPGALLVRRARERGVKIQAFSGHSSITLSLMLSGLFSQNFAFWGYLKREKEGLKEEIIRLEEMARKESQTQIFMEAPHRNQALLEVLLQTLRDQTQLCIATDLTLPTEMVMTQSVAVWKKGTLPNIQKRPTIFLLGTISS